MSADRIFHNFRLIRAGLRDKTPAERREALDALRHDRFGFIGWVCAALQGAVASLHPEARKA